MGFECVNCGNLYAIVIERSLRIINNNSFTGMIVQLPIICTDRMIPIQDRLLEKQAWIYNFDDRPGKLFDGLEHIRATIFIVTKGLSQLHTTRYNRWYSETRQYLFETLSLTSVQRKLHGTLQKVSSLIETNLFNKITSEKKALGLALRSGRNIYYHNAPQYFVRCTDFIPFFYNELEGEKQSSHVKNLTFSSEDYIAATAILNSSLFYWWFVILSNCRDLGNREISNFPFSFSSANEKRKKALSDKCQELMTDYKKNSARKSCYYKSTGNVIYDEYYPKKSKHIIDKIDTILGEYYSFDEKTLDFIISYDIKYRMGEDE